MKKTLFLSSLIFITGIAKAQFGLQAGGTFYSGKATQSSVSINYDLKPGFTAGVVYNASLSGNFSFMPSLNFTQKGGKFNQTGFKDKLTLSYIDLPLNFVYNINGFFIGGGPSVGYGVGGKDKGGLDSLTVTTDVHFGNSEDDDLKPFEISANIIAGYKFSNGVFISANYNPGLNNIAPDNADETKWHNHGFGIRLGILLGGNSKKATADSNQ